jgi:hypothetical protein
MRFLAFFARHPRLRTGLVLVAAATVLAGGARLWTRVSPDAVRITITQVTAGPVYGALHPLKRVVYDRTIQSDATAQRLQRDFARMPIIDLTFDPFAAYLCNHVPDTYDTYTLVWYRAGLPVEQASSDPTGCGGWQGLWQSDGVFVVHAAGGIAKTLYADIAAATASHTTASGQAQWTARPASDARSV